MTARRKRIGIINVSSIDELVATITRSQARTVVVDIEPMLTVWDAPDPDEWSDGALALLARLDGVDSVERVCFLSNSHRVRKALSYNGRLRVSVKSGARKPFGRPPIVGLGGPIVVVGDQVITDGLFAYRIGGSFVRWRYDHPAPLWPQLQALVGRAVAAGMFTQVDTLRVRRTKDKSDGRDDRRAERLQILLADYVACREDERTLVATQATMISVAVSMLGLLGAAIIQTCKLSSKTTGCWDVPDLALAAAPLLPLALLAFLQIHGSAATMRSYYARGLEDEIRRFAPEHLHTLKPLIAPSYFGVVTELMTYRRGHRHPRVLGNFILGVVLVVFGGLAVYIAVHMSTLIKAAMLILYGPIITFMLTSVAVATIGGKSLFEQLARSFLSRKQVRVSLDPPPSDSEREERSLTSYLILPRPEDLVKVIFGPAVFLVATLAARTLDGRHLGRLLLMWVLVEFLVYEARYQWNDVRGVADDDEHPERRARGRLPTGPTLGTKRRNIKISLAVATLKLVVATSLALVTKIGGRYAIASIWILLAAALYETARELARPRTDFRAGARETFIWVAVGLGYPARASVGLMAAGVPLGSLRALLCLGFIFVYGVMFVLMTWALDATSYCTVVTSDDDDSGLWWAKAALNRKPHVAALLPYPRNARLPAAPSDGVEGGSSRALEDSNLLRLPWNTAFLVSAALACALGYVLVQARTSAILVSVCVGFATAVAVAKAPSATIRMTSAVVGPLLQVFMALVSGVRLPALTAVPLIATTLTYAFFRRSTYRDLKAFGNALASVPMAAARAVKSLRRLCLVAAVGRRTLRIFRTPP